MVTSRIRRYPEDVSRAFGAYAVRILLVGELARDLVSPLVAAAGVLAALALTLFEPGPGGRGPARALRIAPLLFLPLALLGAYGVVVRVGQYGWTEFRYLRLALLAALAVAAAGAAWQLARRRPFSVHAVPVLVGPPGGVPGGLRDRRLHGRLPGHALRARGREPARPRAVSSRRTAASGTSEVLGLRWIGPRGMRISRSGPLSEGAVVDAGEAAVIRVRVVGPPGRTRDPGGAFLRDSLTVVVPTEAGG